MTHGPITVWPPCAGHAFRGRPGGQSLVEYTLHIVLAVAALAGMFGYVRSALSHRMKSGADGVGQGLLYGR